MAYIDVYCSFNFLIQFFEEKPDGDVESFEEKQQIWLAFYDFLRQTSTRVFIDIDIKQLEALATQYPFLIFFINLDTQGHILELEEKSFLEFSNLNFYENSWPFKLFFLDKNETDCKNLESQFGYFYLNNETLYNIWPLISIQFLENRNKRILKVSKNIHEEPKLSNWKELKEKYTHPVNSIIICDRYASEKDWVIKENIIEIIKYLLPSKPNLLPIDVTLISLHQAKPVNYVYGCIKRGLNDFFEKGYNINLSVIKLSSFDNHDRMIFTNYFHLESGQSFSYFKSNQVDLSTPTKLFFNPLTGKNSLFVAISLLKDLSSNIKQFDNAGYVKDGLQIKLGSEIRAVESEKRNRLLSIT